MKLLITYSSKTGNTKKLAEGLYNNLPFKEMDIMPIADVRNIDEYDTVLVGYWVDRAFPEQRSKNIYGTNKWKKSWNICNTWSISR